MNNRFLKIKKVAVTAQKDAIKHCDSLTLAIFYENVIYDIILLFSTKFVNIFISFLNNYYQKTH